MKSRISLFWRQVLLLWVGISCVWITSCYGFLAEKSTRTGPLGRRQLQFGDNAQQLFLAEEGSEDLMIVGNSELDSGVYTDDTAAKESGFFRDLENRKLALKNGIGRRYVTRTQQGFLNIHYEPTDPFRTDNVVGQLQEGQIVTSTGPTRGFWIPHDGGGWSVCKHGGFTWLEPIKE